MKAKYWTEMEILSCRPENKPNFFSNDQRGENVIRLYLKQIALDKHVSESYKNNKPH